MDFLDSDLSMLFKFKSCKPITDWYGLEARFNLVFGGVAAFPGHRNIFAIDMTPIVILLTNFGNGNL